MDDVQPIVIPVAYEVSLLPEDHPERYRYVVTVAYRGDDRYAVLNGSTSARMCLNAKTGEWDFEPQATDRTERWLAEHRFTLQEALERAGWEATRMERGGVHVLDVPLKEGS